MEEGIQISREKVRQILRKQGIGTKRKRRHPKHRTRRERKPAPYPCRTVEWET